MNRRFDLCAGILALLIVIAMIASFRQTYELGANRPEGFATWFLLFLAYLPLEIVGLVSWLFGLQDSALVHMLVERHQALALAYSTWRCWQRSGARSASISAAATA